MQIVRKCKGLYQSNSIAHCREMAVGHKGIVGFESGHSVQPHKAFN